MQTAPNSTIKVERCLRSGAGAVLVIGALALLPELLRTAALPAAAALRGLPVAVDDALLGVVAAVAAGCLSWLLLGALLELLTRVPGVAGRTAARVSATVTPRLVRRVVGVGLGMGVGVGLGAGPALAAPARAVTAAVQQSVEGAVLAAAGTPSPSDARDLPDPGWTPAPDPGWTPTAPVVRPQPDVSAISPAARRPPAEAPAEVVVRRGDSLWAVAARHLGPGATDAEVAAEWPRWYATNRHVIGPDPDLVLPGQVLSAPEEAA